MALLLQMYPLTLLAYLEGIEVLRHRPNSLVGLVLTGIQYEIMLYSHRT